jgi:hypothetical protein
VRDDEAHVVRRLCVAETLGELDDVLGDVLVLALELGFDSLMHGALLQVDASVVVASAPAVRAWAAAPCQRR